MGVLRRAISGAYLGLLGSKKAAAVGFSHRVTTGNTGAIASQDTDSTVVAARSSAGVYTLTLPTAFKRLLKFGVVFIGTPGAATTGYQWAVTSDLTSTTGVITVTFTRGSDNAAAELPNNTVFLVWGEAG